MTTILDSVEVPAPRRPWNKKRQTFVRSAILICISLVISWVLSSTTELGGVLGFYFGLAVCLPIVVLIESIRHGRNVAIDRVASSVILAIFGAVVIPWISIVTTVYQKGSKAFHSGYLTTDMRITASGDPLEFGGVLHAIVGTLILVLIASIISVPLGITAAIYVVEIKGRFASTVRFFTQAMSGGPSIVAGLFIYSTICVFFGGFSAWAGALAYTILMLPTVARTSEEVLKLVPDELRAASYALGASQARTVFQVVLPTIATGLVTSAILGIARVAGETAPLILTASYFVATSRNVSEPIASLPIYIFSSLGLGDANATTRAWGGSLVLLIVVFVLFSIARGLSARLSRK